MLLACLVAMLLCCQEHTLTNAVSEVERGMLKLVLRRCMFCIYFNASNFQISLKLN